VGVVIVLQKNSVTITEPFLTIAGQTAPSPGVTFIRGGGINIDTHDVIGAAEWIGKSLFVR